MAKKATSPVPEGYHTITPHLVVNDGRKAIEFYKKAFGAVDDVCMPGPDGKTIMHAELRIGDSMLFLADEMPPYSRSPKSIGGSGVTIHLYVPDCDTVYKRAVDAGATATMPPADMFWGDRYGKLTDPFGHEWSIATHKEDLTPEEMAKRSEAAMKEFGKQ